MKVPEGGVPQVLNEKVYTNETVALVAKKLFPLVGGLSSLVAKGPKDLAAKLDKETCAGAIAALNAAAATLGADGKPVDKLDAWQYLTVVDGDFGFANGDKEGFLDAVASLFRPLSLLTTVVSFENTTSLFYGPQLGIYEDLIPIFEALGIKDFMTPTSTPHMLRRAPTQTRRWIAVSAASSLPYSLLLTQLPLRNPRSTRF